MTHFGVICPPFSGHLNPLAALGRELRSPPVQCSVRSPKPRLCPSRGHRVTFLQISDLEPKILSEGLNFYPIGQSIYQPGELAETLAQLGQLSGIPALRYSLNFCQRMTAIICQDTPAAIEAAGIEALLVDQMEPAGEAIAELLNIPFISVCNAQAIHRSADVPPFFTPWSYQNTWWARLRNHVTYYILDCSSQPILQVLNEYRQKWKLPTNPRLYASRSRLAQISQQSAAFDFPCAHLPKHFYYTGPLRNLSPYNVPFPFERLTGQPLIYASLGSMQNTKQEIFECIAAACQALDVQLVITLGSTLNTQGLQRLPGYPLVVQYAPQMEVIAKAKLTITHGGLNTVLDSLSYGVPLIAIPITYEQPGNAARIKWTGTGEVIPLTRLSISKLQAAIQRVLTEDFYLNNALRIKRSLLEAGGVKRAADIVEQSIQSEIVVSDHI
ncbi:glycosyl transferase family 1 [Nostocales cyanobacterium HT-58-2]|nr:glycosyl transferase family 1 [Nostocales cyanobacterium HT-58-2]